MIERTCPNCKRETEDRNETICLGCGHATHKAEPKAERDAPPKSFKATVKTKGKHDQD